MLHGNPQLSIREVGFIICDSVADVNRPECRRTAFELMSQVPLRVESSQCNRDITLLVAAQTAHPHSP